jgi:hypothetical protein
VGNATTTVAGLVALADSADVVAGTPGKAVTTDVLKSTLDALPVGEGEGNTISVAFTGSWPAERPTQSADAVVLCLDPTGTAEPPSWFIEGKDTFAGPTSATAQIYELAVRDGWTAMFDPAMATIVDGEIVIPDLLGNLADPFKGQPGQGVINENGYGALARLALKRISQVSQKIRDNDLAVNDGGHRRVKHGGPAIPDRQLIYLSGCRRRSRERVFALDKPARWLSRPRRIKA